MNKNECIDKMKITDEMIIDQTPLADKFVKKYNKNFKKHILFNENYTNYNSLCNLLFS